MFPHFLSGGVPMPRPPPSHAPDGVGDGGDAPSPAWRGGHERPPLRPCGGACACHSPGPGPALDLPSRNHHRGTDSGVDVAVHCRPDLGRHLCHHRHHRGCGGAL